MQTTPFVKKNASYTRVNTVLSQFYFHKLLCLLQQSGPRQKSGRKRALDVARGGESGEIVSLSAIERLAKKSKRSKEERMETVMAGREGREKYGFKVRTLLVF